MLIACVEYNESNKEDGINKINYPLNNFPFIGNKNLAYPYTIVFRDRVGDSPFGGGITLIIGYEYSDEMHGAQIALNYTGYFRYRHKDKDSWTDWKIVASS